MYRESVWEKRVKERQRERENKIESEKWETKREGKWDREFNMKRVFWIVCIRNENGRPIILSPTLRQQLKVEDTADTDLILGEHLMVELISDV